MLFCFISKSLDTTRCNGTLDKNEFGGDHQIAGVRALLFAEHPDPERLQYVSTKMTDHIRWISTFLSKFLKNDHFGE